MITSWKRREHSSHDSRHILPGSLDHRPTLTMAKECNNRHAVLWPPCSWPPYIRVPGGSYGQGHIPRPGEPHPECHGPNNCTPHTMNPWRISKLFLRLHLKLENRICRQIQDLRANFWPKREKEAQRFFAKLYIPSLLQGIEIKLVFALPCVHGSQFLRYWLIF